MGDLMQEMFRDLVERGIDKAQALIVLRALSRYFGGQQLYIPQKLRNSTLAEEILGVMADEIGYPSAEEIYDIIATLYGGVQWYIPLEKNAFRAAIAKEILAAYDGTTKTRQELCRKYNISFTQVYRLFYEGRRNEAQKELDFD